MFPDRLDSFLIIIHHVDVKVAGSLCSDSLPKSIASGLLLQIDFNYVSFQGERWTFSTTAPFIPTYVMSNLSLSSDPAGMYNTRVKGRHVLLENPTRESRAKKELDEKRAKQRKEREEKKSGVLSKKKNREMGLWKLDEAQAK